MTGPAPLSPEGLVIARLEAGDISAGTEAEARALGGSIHCQRAMLAALYVRRSQGFLTASEYLDAAEPLARMAASSGVGEDVRRWAILLAMRGDERRSSGALAGAVLAQAESVVILNRLAERGDDIAAGQLDELAPQMLAEALNLASRSLRCSGARIAFPLPDSVPWGLSVPAPALEETRLERVRWWFSDRWWDFRMWVADKRAAWRGE